LLFFGLPVAPHWDIGQRPGILYRGTSARFSGWAEYWVWKAYCVLLDFGAQVRPLEIMVTGTPQSNLRMDAQSPYVKPGRCNDDIFFILHPSSFILYPSSFSSYVTL
jgi:hypothetical protein